MVLVDLQWIKGTQFFADNGEVLDSGTINIYDATTTSLRTTYSNYLGTVANTLNGSNQIVLASDGRLDESVYIPTGLWKFVLKDSAGNTIATEDNIEGALDTDALAITEALPNTPVISKTSDYTIVNGDQGKVINANPTGGSFVLTLPSAATVGDGWRITIRHVGTANQVTIAGVSSQTINGATSRALGAQYESVCLVSDGANWHIDGHAQGFNYGQVPFFYVESRTLTTPPTNPTAGARYITAASGTLTGLWSAYTNGDVSESDGQGGWIRLQPVEGWTAYDKTANQHCLFVTAWEGLPATDDPEESTLETALFAHSVAANTGGGTASTGAWTTRVINAEIHNSITGASLASNTVTLPTGDYWINAQGVFVVTGNSRLRFISTTNSSKVIYSPMVQSGTGDSTSASATVFGKISVTDATEDFRLEYYCASAGTLGNAQNVTVNEFHASIGVINLSSLQGPQGDQGTQGPEGFAGFQFTFSSTTSMADPGAGVVRLNNATLSSVTAIAIDDTSAASGNPDLSTEILTWDNSSSTKKGRLKISKVGAAQNFVTVDLDSITDNSGWSQLAVTYVDHAGSFSNTDSVAVEFIEKGDKGDAGATGPTGSTSFNFDTTTADADPGSGGLRLNNATAASATAAYIDNNNRGGSDVSAWIDTFDDNGNSTLRGYLYIFDAASPSTIFHIYTVSGSVTDGTGYRKVTIATVTGAGAFSNGNEVVVVFVPRGPAGSGLADVVDDTTPQLGGTLDTNAKQVRYSKGADVASPGGGALTLGTDGNYFDITGTNAITSISTLAVGTYVKLHFDAALTLTHNATDLILPGGANITTAAGDEAEFVEYASGDWRCTSYVRASGPVDAAGQGKQTIYIPASAMITATTSGAATASLESSTNDVNYKVFDFDASADEHVHFNIAMPKNWDEGTITFQVLWSSTATDTDGVAWGLQAVALSDSDAIDTAWGTAVVVTDAAQSTAGDVYVTSESSAVTIAGTPAVGDLTFFRLFRDVSDAADTHVEDARLIGMRLFYTTNAPNDI